MYTDGKHLHMYSDRAGVLQKCEKGLFEKKVACPASSCLSYSYSYSYSKKTALQLNRETTTEPTKDPSSCTKSEAKRHLTKSRATSKNKERRGSWLRQPPTAAPR